MTKRRKFSEGLLNGYLNEPQRSAIKEITEICNKAVHGAEITTEQAGQKIDLTTQLNNSFSYGYSINLEPNTNYRENGHTCEWEHCIEYSPFGEHNDLASCPIYGHERPVLADCVKLLAPPLRVRTRSLTKDTVNNTIKLRLLASPTALVSTAIRPT